MGIGLAVGVGVGCSIGGTLGLVPASDKTLIVLIGQSTAAQEAPPVNLSALNTRYATPYTPIQMLSWQSPPSASTIVWTTNSPTPTAVEPVTWNPGTGLSALYMGSEMAMMEDLDVSEPGSFAFLRVAMGGTSSADWAPTSVTLGTPNLYNQALTYIKQAMGALGCSTVVLVWSQGASDAKSSTPANAYQAWLTAFIASWRASLGAIGPGGGVVPFILDNLCSNNPAFNPDTNFPFWATVQAAQIAVGGAVSSCTALSTDSITNTTQNFQPTGGTNVVGEYNADAYTTIGHLYSGAIGSYCGVHIHPIAQFTTSTALLVATFTDASVTPGSSASSWLWHFGDGGTSTSQNPQHTYSTAGTYNVTLTVTDGHGLTNTCTAVPVAVIGGIAGVTRDSLSGWYCPASATEWTTFLGAGGINLAISGPDDLWPCQDSSSGLADAIGSVSLTSAGSVSYSNAVAGWTRLSANLADASAQSFSSTSASLPNILTVSQLVIAYVRMPASAPAAARAGPVTLGTIATTRCETYVNTNGTLGVESTTSHQANGASPMCDGHVHPIVLKCDRTNNVVTMYTELEKVTPTFGATMTGSGLDLGDAVATTASLGYLYVASFNGSHGELTDANVKALIQGLTGLTITGY